MPLLVSTDRGLFCEAGDFYIDPWKPVDRALITHAHSDHARWGSKLYVTSKSGGTVLRERLGPDASIDTVPYGERITRNGVNIWFYPAGHLLGSSQIKIEHQGEVWVVSGDYKVESERTSEPFEPIRCNTFITESTFALPIYAWLPQSEIFRDIDEWRSENIQNGRTSVIFAYALGKAQRLLAGIDPTLTPIIVHGSVARFHAVYQNAGIELPKVGRADFSEKKGRPKESVLVIAPPSVQGTPWLRKFGEISTAFASGWMQIRGMRRRRGYDRGFALSDHADWTQLNEAIAATGAEKVLVTHGYTTQLVRWLRENGKDADTIATHFEYEESDESEETPEMASNETAGPLSF